MKEMFTLAAAVLATLLLWSGIAFVLISLMAAVFMLGWNHLVLLAFPTAPELGFWQSFAVVTVVGVLTGNIGIKKS